VELHDVVTVTLARADDADAAVRPLQPAGLFGYDHHVR
jgi:hypothetical protein